MDINVPKIIQQKLLNIAGTLNLSLEKANTVYKLYWATTVSTDISGYAGGDSVTIEGGITKNDLVNGLTIAEQVINFFGNSAVTTADYRANIFKIIYTNKPKTPPVVSNPVEELGKEVMSLVWDLINCYNEAKVIYNLYFKNEVSDIVTAIDAQRIVPGSDLTASDMSAGITLLSNFVSFMDNSAVSTADYQSTLSKLLAYRG